MVLGSKENRPLKCFGKQTAIDLANHFRTLFAIKSATTDKLMEVEGIAEVVAQSIYDYFRDPKQLQLIDKLISVGVKVIDAKPVAG